MEFRFIGTRLFFLLSDFNVSVYVCVCVPVGMNDQVGKENVAKGDACEVSVGTVL